ELINIPGMKRITDMSEKVISHLATVPERPEYTEPKKKVDKKDDKKDDKKEDKKDDKKDPKKDIPRLGIQPDYEEGTDGLKVLDVRDGGVAAAAGLKAGDVIVEIAGKQVKDIETYMAAMAEQKIGQTIEIGVMRDKKKVTLKALLK